MTGIIRIRSVFMAAGVLTLMGALLFTGMAEAAEEVASAIRRYKQHEVSTGYYEDYEVLPRRQRPFVEIPGVKRGIFPYSPTSAQVRVRTRLADSLTWASSFTPTGAVKAVISRKPRISIQQGPTSPVVSAMAENLWPVSNTTSPP